jgi:hypothetical protein
VGGLRATLAQSEIAESTARNWKQIATLPIETINEAEINLTAAGSERIRRAAWRRRSVGSFWPLIADCHTNDARVIVTDANENTQ